MTKSITTLALLLGLFLSRNATAQGISWISSCTDRDYCLNQNSCTQGNVLMVASAITSCGNPSVNFSYKIDLFNNGSNDITMSNDTVSGNFAKGTHKISWKVTDNCGNANSCTYLFTIKDCQPPTLTCINGLTQQIEQPLCSESFYAKTFILNYSDNCTPTNQIQIGIRKAGTSTGFPTDTALIYGNCEVGLNFVEIFVKDGNGLVNQCNSYVLVQDGDADCFCNKDGDLNITACVRTPNNRKAPNYILKANVKALSGAGTPYDKNRQKNSNDSCSNLVFDKMPFGATYLATLRAENNLDPTLGVSTLDLVAISKHILNLEPFTTAYQTFAADANESGSVTTFDIVELRKLILGVYDTLPLAPAWRLIKPIPNPANLLGFLNAQDTFQRSFPDLSDDHEWDGLNFIAVKIGDVNYSSTPLQEDEVDDRGPALPLLDRAITLRQGEQMDIPISIVETADAHGWQMGLGFDPEKIKLLDVKGLNEENVNIDAQGKLRLLDFHADTRTITPENPLFSVTITALKDLNLPLSKLFALENEHFVSEFYTLTDRRPFVQYTLAPSTGKSTCIGPLPNPMSSAFTCFELFLAEKSRVTFRVFDSLGRNVHVQEDDQGAGKLTLRLDRAALMAKGVYFYTISVGAGHWSGKIIVD
jgi:hypothetical protein